MKFTKSFLIISASMSLLAIAGFPSFAQAGLQKVENQNLDKQYRLKRIFLFPSVDDLSGVLSPGLDQKLAEYFQKNTRFELVRDQNIIRALSADEATYAKVANNNTVHKEAAKAAKADATIFLKTKTVGQNTEITLEWREASGSLIYSETAALPAYSALTAQTNLAEALLDEIVKKLPFRGTVTGRSGKTITIDLGTEHVMPGDQIELGRLTSIQRHPLLKTIVNFDYVKVGEATVSTVDRVLAFADVKLEEPNEYISPDNKIIRIKKMELPRLREEKKEFSPLTKIGKDDPLDPRLPSLIEDFDSPKARLGGVSAALLLGSLTHTQTVSGNTIELSGAAYGGAINGELWVTKNWIAGLAYEYLSSNSISGPQSSGGPNISSTGASWSNTSIFGAYKFIPNERTENIAITFGLGNAWIKMDMPLDLTNNISRKEFSGIYLLIDGSIKLNAKNIVVAKANFLPFAGMSEAGGTLGAIDSSNGLLINIGWMYQFIPNLYGKIAGEYANYSGSYTNGNATSEKKMSLAPTIAYYF